MKPTLRALWILTGTLAGIAVGAMLGYLIAQFVAEATGPHSDWGFVGPFFATIGIAGLIGGVSGALIANRAGRP